MSKSPFSMPGLLKLQKFLHGHNILDEISSLIQSRVYFPMWGTISFSLKMGACSISLRLLRHSQCGVNTTAVPPGFLGGFLMVSICISLEMG